MESSYNCKVTHPKHFYASNKSLCNKCMSSRDKVNRKTVKPKR